MVRITSILLIVFSLEVQANECLPDDTDVQGQVKKINERYDDFFRVQREREEHVRRLEASRENLRKKREDRERELEKARVEFIKNRRPKSDTSKLEAEFDAQLKARDRRLEVARRCYVNRKNAAEQMLKKGRAIPGLTEFGLDEY